jgi:FKBP-type peptidyl-prolyl cis-trans isomerase FklB
MGATENTVSTTSEPQVRRRIPAGAGERIGVGSLGRRPSLPSTPFCWGSVAVCSKQWDNGVMPRSFIRSGNVFVNLWTAGVLLLGSVYGQAQQAPPAKTQSTSAAKARKAPAAKSPTSLALTTPKDKFSYALGMNLGTSLNRQSVPVDPNIVLRGLKDSLAGGKTLLTDDQAKAALTEVQNQLRQKQQEQMQAAGEANKREGEAFLAANKSKEGIVSLPSGLQYKILTPGTGSKPTAADTVVCNYRGTLLSGAEFDSSYKRGQPATFSVGGVIKGWTEALPLMPVGSKWQLFIPAELAYGERAPGPEIGPNATLIFEVELLSIQNKSEEKK